MCDKMFLIYAIFVSVGIGVILLIITSLKFGYFFLNLKYIPVENRHMTFRCWAVSCVISSSFLWRSAITRNDRKSCLFSFVLQSIISTPLFLFSWLVLFSLPFLWLYYSIYKKIMGRYNGTLKLYRRNIFLILSLLESCIIDVKRCVNYEDKYLIVQKSCKYLFREQTM